jgi:GH25 family lysozyme M1 (1,4-beta-N-acetylmuramidase)
MWQCSETGKVPGISTNVDVNYVYYDYLGYTRNENVATSEPTMEPTISASPIPSDGTDTGTTNTDAQNLNN